MADQSRGGRSRSIRSIGTTAALGPVSDLAPATPLSISHAARMERQLTLDTDDMSSSTPGSGHALEPALEDLDSKLHRLTADVARLAKGMRRAQEAARLGQVKDMPKLLAEVQSSAAAAAESARQLGWHFDVRRWLGSGAYASEVIALAKAKGLGGVREVNGELLSFPLIVRIDAPDNSVVMGKRRERGIRPSHVVGLLTQARQKQTAASAVQLLPALEHAYLLQTKGQAGVAVPLREVYDVLTLRPGQSKEYTELDFLVAIYILDKGGPHTTKSGYRLSFPASTTTRSGKGYQFVTEQGEEKVYSAIRLDR
jgi:hypothetical protein